MGKSGWILSGKKNEAEPDFPASLGDGGWGGGEEYVSIFPKYCIFSLG